MNSLAFAGFASSSIVDQYGDRVFPIGLDLSKPETILEAAEKANDVQIVVNNAGVLKTATPLDESALDTLDFEMEINVRGLIRMAQAFSPILKINGGGAFVQLNSVASMKSFASFATYSASKAAAYSITQALHEWLAEQGTLVVSVHPGPIATDMVDSVGLTDIAEPPSVVADVIVTALENGQFHVFPDTMAKNVGDAYEGFAKNIIEANLVEG